jgi:uncharacterized membrane protein
VSESQDFFDKPENIKRILHVVYGICALLVVLDFIVHRHTEHPLEGLYGFYPIYGFVGCVVLVLVAKLMRKVLMRDENYYQGDDAPVEEVDHAKH